MPNISYSKDNSIWGYLGPSRGSRYYLNAIGSPKIGDQGKEFFTTSFDFRHYIAFGREYSIAMRLAGGASYGKNPTLFVMGGLENWLNYKYASQIDYNSIDEYFLSEWMMPLGFHSGEPVDFRRKRLVVSAPVFSVSLPVS